MVEKQPPAYAYQLGCRYRTPEGRRCLIGAAIPDDMYDQKIEGKRAEGALAAIGMELVGPSDPYELRLSDLQSCHDIVAANPDYHTLVERNLRAFAACHSLEIPA